MKSVPRLIRWLIEAALVGAAAAASAASPAVRFPITPQQIADALTARGLPVVAAQVLLPMQMSSATSAPALVAGEPAAAGNHLARVRISCSDRAECLPFYVSVTETSVAQPGAAAAGLTRLPLFTSPAPPVLRAGARALLAIDDHRIHIRVQVIALENGEPGRTVRVSSLDHKQTFRAQVIDSTLVKGSL